MSQKMATVRIGKDCFLGERGKTYLVQTESGKFAYLAIGSTTIIEHDYRTRKTHRFGLSALDGETARFRR